VEARIRTVVERAITPLIAVEVYHPQTGRLDKVTQAEKERQVQAIVQQALGAYGSLKNDPLGMPIKTSSETPPCLEIGPFSGTPAAPMKSRGPGVGVTF
jgi:hypothetical protein